MIPIHDFQINTQPVISHSSKWRVESVLLTLVNSKVYPSLRISWIPRISLQNYWMPWVKRLRNDIFRRRHWKSIYWKNLQWSTTYALPISSFHSKKINKPWYMRRVLIWNALLICGNFVERESFCRVLGKSLEFINRNLVTVYLISRKSHRQ